MTFRVLITGATGLLGRAIYKKLCSDKSLNVFGCGFTRKRENIFLADLTDRDQLESLFEEIKPDAVIHCAAERKPDVVERRAEYAEAINVLATENLCTIAALKRVWVLFISTDYVFDGTKAPYDVSDTPNPLNMYGSLKLAGERAVLKSSTGNAVLRIPILYGQVESLDESAVTVLYAKVKDLQHSSLMDNWQRRYPTNTLCVADIVHQMLTKHAANRNVSGIYHFSEQPMMTKYDMACTMADVMGLSKAHITADNNSPSGGAPPGGTPRPHNCQLSVSRLEAEGFHLPSADFASSIKQCLSDFN